MPAKKTTVEFSIETVAALIVEAEKSAPTPDFIARVKAALNECSDVILKLKKQMDDTHAASLDILAPVADSLAKREEFKELEYQNEKWRAAYGKLSDVLAAAEVDFEDVTRDTERNEILAAQKAACDAIQARWNDLVDELDALITALNEADQAAKSHDFKYGTAARRQHPDGPLRDAEARFLGRSMRDLPLSLILVSRVGGEPLLSDRHHPYISSPRNPLAGGLSIM